MAIVWLDTPNDPEEMLEARDASIDFLSDRDCAFIMAGFGAYGEEGVYRDGAFLPRYLTSTRTPGEGDGFVWSVRRDGGWPVQPAFSVEETVSAAPGLLSTLTPTLYSPLAQWALRGAPHTPTLYQDRSGNGRHITSGTANAVLDYAPGELAVVESSLKLTDATLGTLAGPMTVTCRLAVVNASSNSGWQAIFSIGGADVGNNDLLVFSRIDDAGVLSYYCQTGSDANVSWQSAIVPPIGAWAFMSLRRHASGRVTIGCNDVFQLSPALTPATFRGYVGPTAIGWSTSTSFPGRCQGGLADVSVWGRDLTDEELLPLYRAAMGIAA